DAYDYGSIAAANSLSDIYAMGGKPFLALNVAALPDNLPNEISSEIIRGGAEKAREAGVVIAGGHTVKDQEPKYGLVVIGFVHPQKMLSKGGLQVGDALVLTKPLGFGVTTTALKREQADEADVREAVDWMKRLNDKAGQLASEFDLRGGTDITGFGFLGHAMEMADASGVGLNFEFVKIPFISCARKYADKGCFAGGAFDNKGYFEAKVRFAETIDEENQMLLFDPQTSGGLLLGVPQEKLEEFTSRARELDQAVWVVGSVETGSGINVR
ncbi:MAG: selenide, water dikinase SelD, partial [Anaerolineales bacterium]|nr:selenide, water dikinase SelD [Anaerolineales bacterium]